MKLLDAFEKKSDSSPRQPIRVALEVH